MPMRADDKPMMLHKLQGSIHFEKSLTDTTAAGLGQNSSGMTIPSWFVLEHGDKFQKVVMLRTGSSSKSWPVNLVVSCYSPTGTQVRFGGGWRKFVASNGLFKGDALIFELTAKSEFKVYAFRSCCGLPSCNPPPKRRRRNYDPDHPRGKAKRTCLTSRDARLRVHEERSEEATKKSNKTSSKAYGAAIAPIPPSDSVDSVDSVDHLPSFCKTLTATNVGGHGPAILELPRDFCRKQGSRIRAVLKLQGIHKESPERTVTLRTSFGKDTRHYLRAEWDAFVRENCLYEGQVLLFALAADSFVVREGSALQLRT